jgi:hypothetical protein
MTFKLFQKNFADGHWHKHRNALVYIVGVRGGYEAIKNECLQITLTWYVITRL